MRKRIGFLLFCTVALGAYLGWRAFVPRSVVEDPAMQQALAPEGVRSLTAFIDNSPQKLPNVPEFLVPAEHVPRVLATLRSAERDDRPAKWPVLGHMKLVRDNGEVVEIHLFWTRGRDAKFEAFAASPTWEDRVYYRGGNSQALEDALRTAYADSLKK